MRLLPRRRPRAGALLGILLDTLLLAGLPTTARALVLPVQGVLRSQSGGPVADGPYPMVFSLYAAAAAKTPVFEQTHIGVMVKGGMFHTTLGEDPKAPLAAEFFAKHPRLWLGVKISIEAELPRVAVATVPYAARAGSAAVADALSGPLDGKQLRAGSVPSTALAFGYAASDSKGGPAKALACTGCITTAHLAKGVLNAKNMRYDIGKLSMTAAQAFDDLYGRVVRTPTGLGIGKTPAAQCKIDLAGGDGGLCVQGIPARVVLVAGDAKAMKAAARPGQLVFRRDENKAYMRVGKRWRRLAFQAECGDGIKEGAEQCDDGNTSSADGCTALCRPNVCGDGLRWVGKEACDDGNTDSTDACIACKPAGCGDGFIHKGVEKCDGQEFGGATCASVAGAGFAGALKCANACKTIDTSACKTPLGTKGHPAASCKAIADAKIGAKNGVFWLERGTTRARVYCDLAGGGWMLAAAWNVGTATKNPSKWGRTAAGDKVAPDAQHAVPFSLLMPRPKQVKFVHLGNGQSFTATITGSGWQGAPVATRIPATGGYLIFGQQTNPSGICVVNGAYSDGYTCDGNQGQISGHGLFNTNTRDEACGCDGHGWKVGTGGCAYNVCKPAKLTQVWLR